MPGEGDQRQVLMALTPGVADVKGSETVKRSKSPKRILSSDCSLQLDCMKPESLVIAGLHTGGMCTEPCRRRPSSCESRGRPKSPKQPYGAKRRR